MEDEANPSSSFFEEKHDKITILLSFLKNKTIRFVMFFRGEMEEKYVIALDLSLSNSGVCIFDKNRNPVELCSIPTNGKDPHGVRLKNLADSLFHIRSKYDIDLAVFEKGFSRFNQSTQAVFKATGVANYVFYDCEQIYYAPSSVKKIVSGNGRTDKAGIRKIIESKYPHLKIANEDESDAVSIGLAYFIDKLGG